MSPTRMGPDKLVSYLSQLSPESAAFLVREIELHRQAGEDDPSYEHILGAVRQMARVGDSSVERLTTPLRLFCEPFADLLVNDKLGARLPVRVSRTSINPVWAWLNRPNESKDFGEIVAELLSESQSGGRRALEDLQNRMIDSAATEIEQATRLARRSRKRQAQLSSLLGGDDVISDASTMAAAFRAFEAIKWLRSVISARIADLDGDNCTAISDALAAFNRGVSNGASIGFATVLARLAEPSQAVRLAVRDLVTEDAVLIAQSAYAPLGELLLGDLEIAARRVDILVRNGADPVEIVDALHQFHKYAEGLSTELEMDARSDWGRALAASRKIASQALDSELRRVPENISLLFKPYINGRGARVLAEPDNLSMQTASRSLVLNRDCRQFLSQLSLHEAVMRGEEALRVRLETITDTILGDLRSTTGERQKLVQSWFDITVALTHIAFGGAHAEILARSGTVARSGGGTGQESAANG